MCVLLVGGTQRSCSRKPFGVPRPLTPFLDFTPSGNQVSFSKSADAFAFEEDSSSDGLSPDQARSEDPQGSAGSPADTKASETPLAGPLGPVQVNKSLLRLSCFHGLQSTPPPLVLRRDPRDVSRWHLNFVPLLPPSSPGICVRWPKPLENPEGESSGL